MLSWNFQLPAKSFARPMWSAYPYLSLHTNLQRILISFWFILTNTKVENLGFQKWFRKSTFSTSSETMRKRLLIHVGVFTPIFIKFWQVCQAFLNTKVKGLTFHRKYDFFQKKWPSTMLNPFETMRKRYLIHFSVFTPILNEFW